MTQPYQLSQVQPDYNFVISRPILMLERMSTISFGFGERLRMARQQKGLTGEALGKGAGEKGKDASKQSVADWEHDRHYPKADQLRIICIKLGISADHLLFGDVAERLKLTQAEQVVQLLTPEQRRELIAKMMGDAASDETVEKRMKITKTLKKKDRPQGPDSSFGGLE